MRILAWVAVLCSFMISASTDAKAPSALAGHYYLEDVMEVGSELMLDESGGYEWLLSYGALDQGSTGRWTIEDDTVVRTPRDGMSNDPATPSLLPRRLRIEGRTLVPADDFGGRYVLEVEPEAQLNLS